MIDRSILTGEMGRAYREALAAGDYRAAQRALAVEPLYRAALLDLVVIIITTAIILYTGWWPVIGNAAVFVIGYTGAAVWDWRRIRRPM